MDTGVNLETIKFGKPLATSRIVTGITAFLMNTAVVSPTGGLHMLLDNRHLNLGKIAYIGE